MSITSSNAAATPTTMAQMLNAPALSPPFGVIPIMSTHSPRQAWSYVCLVLTSVVPGALLLLRLYTKIYIIRRMNLTDYLTILAYFNLIAMLAVSHLCIINGAGAHQWNITVGQFNNIIHWVWLEEILYGSAISLIKTVILLQYQHIFAPRKSVDPLLYISSWVLIALVVLWNFISTVIAIFACTPQEKFWNTLITYGHCLDYEVDVLLTAIFNILVDILILVLPTRAVWRLQIPTRKKLAIVSVFAIGLFACIANANIILFTVRQTGDNADVSWNVWWMGLWAFAELSLGLIVICALSLPKFIESRGHKLRIFFSGIVKPFTTSISLRNLKRSTTDVNSLPREVDIEDLSTLAPSVRHGVEPLDTRQSSKDYDYVTSPHLVHAEELSP